MKAADIGIFSARLPARSRIAARTHVHFLSFPASAAAGFRESFEISRTDKGGELPPSQLATLPARRNLFDSRNEQYPDNTGIFYRTFIVGKKTSFVANYMKYTGTVSRMYKHSFRKYLHMRLFLLRSTLLSYPPVILLPLDSCSSLRNYKSSETRLYWNSCCIVRMRYRIPFRTFQKVFPRSYIMSAPRYLIQFRQLRINGTNKSACPRLSDDTSSMRDGGRRALEK